MASILAIEDNIETLLRLKHALEGEHRVFTCYDLNSARECIKSEQIDLILLDLMLPDGNGISLCEELSTNHSGPRIPIVILSALKDVETKVSSLKLGADDYIIKPFEKQELLARIESVLRRGPTRHTEAALAVADVYLDLSKQSAFQKIGTQSENLSLTPIEFKILTNLMQSYGTDLSRDQLSQSIWDQTFTSKRNVDTHICKLRKKLESTQLDINNKRGKGYSLRPSLAGKKNVDSKTVESLPAYGTNRRFT